MRDATLHHAQNSLGQRVPGNVHSVMYCDRRLYSLEKRGVVETMTAPQLEMALYSLFDVTFPECGGTVCSVEFFRKSRHLILALSVFELTRPPLTACGLLSYEVQLEAALQLSSI